MSKKSLSVAVILVVCLGLSAQARAQSAASDEGRCPQVLYVGNCKTNVPATLGGECLQPGVEACLKAATGSREKSLDAFAACAREKFRGQLDRAQVAGLVTCAESWNQKLIRFCAGKSVTATGTADAIDVLWLDEKGMADTDPWGNEQECESPSTDSEVCELAEAQARVNCAAECLNYVCLRGWIAGKSCGVGESSTVSTSPSASTSTGACVQECSVTMQCTCACT